jgi:hypothetical protein
MLQELCASACESSLNSLTTALTSGCGNEYFNFGGQNMTFPQMMDYVQYKYGLICLAEDDTSDFCSDVESR